MGCCLSAPAKKVEPLYYCNHAGKLITFTPIAAHSRKDELSFVNTEEANSFEAFEECYLIYAPWLDYWFEYCSAPIVVVKGKGKSKTQATCPQHINNYELIDMTTGLLKPDAMLKKDFRPIKKSVWEYLFHLYGGGPVIYFFVPSGLDIKEYKKGTWVKHVNFRDSIKIIHPTNTKPKLLAPATATDEVNPLITMSIYSMQQDVGASKIRQAMALQTEINETIAESVGATFAKELGKQKFAQAEKMEVEVKEQKSEAIAAIFVDDMAESKKRQAEEKHKQELRAQEERVMEGLKGLGAKQRFRTYLKMGKIKEAEVEAARMLQGVWRCKQARKKVELRRLEKQRLQEERAAIKLQGRWRVKKSRDRIKALKAEQQRLREEGAAIMLQSAWRIRKAREKVNRLKAEKQRLLEEGSALMMQAAWRRRRACKEVHAMRIRRNKENAAKRLLGNLVLKYIARLKYRRQKRQAIQVLAITLKSASDLKVADITGASDPYAMVQGWHVQEGIVHTPNPLKKSASSVRSLFSGSSKAASLYKSQVVNRNLNPVWNEGFVLTGITGYDDIVVTIADHDTLTQHDFLGQVVIHLADYDKVFAGKSVDLTLPLQRFQLPVKDSLDKDVSLGDLEGQVKGSVSLSLHLPSQAFVHAGTMLRQSKGVGFGIGAEFKPRYFVLTRDRLAYFPDSFSMSIHPKGVLPCESITSVEYVAKGGASHYVISTGKEHWEIRFTSDGALSAEAAREVWFRKLHNCCRNASFTKALSHPEAAMVSPVAKTTSKRSSLFGGK